MAYKFNDEDKTANDMAERLPFGVNDVVITAVEAGTNANGNDFIKLTVENTDGISEDVSVYFTDKSAKYSFATLRQIAVHNADGADKEKARMAMENCVDSDAIVDLFNKNLIGGQAWVEKYYDPNNTYEREGQTFQSVNTNLRGYEPKLKPELMQKNDAVQNAFPGAEPVTGADAASVPADSAWGAKK